MENTNQIIKKVTNGVKKKSASHKVEKTVMKAIMNDTDYSADIYDGKDGVEKYYPSRDLRKVVAKAVSSITKISTKEEKELVSRYEFTKSDDQSIQILVKNLYLHIFKKNKNFLLTEEGFLTFNYYNNSFNFYDNLL